MKVDYFFDLRPKKEDICLCGDPSIDLGTIYPSKPLVSIKSSLTVKKIMVENRRKWKLIVVLLWCSYLSSFAVLESMGAFNSNNNPSYYVNQTLNARAPLAFITLYCNR